MTTEEPERPAEQQEEDREVHQRVLLPLLIPAIGFLFALLVIYGLSRIYLELNEVSVGDVTLATPLAIGVSLAILGAAAYMASRPHLGVVEVGSVVTVAVLLLTGGAIAAAVIDEDEPEGHVVENGPTETPGPPGSVGVELTDSPFAVTPAQASADAGDVTFSVTNAGATPHNFRVISTDLDAESLPTINGVVDEAQLDVVGSLDTFGAGETLDLTVPLDPGAYVLICNVPGHYDAGMRADFTSE